LSPTPFWPVLTLILSPVSTWLVRHGLPTLLALLIMLAGFGALSLASQSPASRPTTRTLDGDYGVQEFFEDHRAVRVCCGKHHREQDAVSVRNRVVLRARLDMYYEVTKGLLEQVREQPPRISQLRLVNSST
jgi:hypothetical protein